MVYLEVRVPFLGYRIVDFSFKNIPGHCKAKAMTLKYLLKKLARRVFPRELNLNRKWGFSMPVSDWFRGSLFPELKRALHENREQFFEKDVVERLQTGHQ